MQLQKALHTHVRKKEYLKAIMDGSHRFTLTGEQAEEITDAERENARMLLADETERRKPLKLTTKKNSGLLKMHAKAAKTSFSIQNFQEYAHLNTDNLSKVVISIQTPSGKVKAYLNPKTFKKVQKSYAHAPEITMVTVSGELDLKTLELNNAGIIAQTKKSLQKT